MDILDKLLFNLKTIAAIPKGKKISTAKEFIVIDDDSLMQPITRWRSGETRDKAVQAICREVRTIIKLSKYIMESKYLYIESTVDTNDDRCDIAVSLSKTVSKRDERINELKKIHVGLTEAYCGIDNICETYCDDTNVLAPLKQLIGEINEHTSSILKLLIELGEYVDSHNKFNI